MVAALLTKEQRVMPFTASLPRLPSEIWHRIDKALNSLDTCMAAVPRHPKWIETDSVYVEELAVALKEAGASIQAAHLKNEVIDGRSWPTESQAESWARALLQCGFDSALTPVMLAKWVSQTTVEGESPVCDPVFFDLMRSSLANFTRAFREATRPDPTTKHSDPRKDGNLPDFVAIAESQQVKDQQRKLAEKLQAEDYEKRRRLSKAFHETAHFAKQDAEARLGKELSREEFCRHWADKFVHLGEQLKANNLVARLEQLDLDDLVEAYTVGLYKLGCVGDEEARSQLTALLLTVCETEALHGVRSWLSRLPEKILAKDQDEIPAEATRYAIEPFLQDPQNIKTFDDLREWSLAIQKWYHRKKELLESTGLGREALNASPAARSENLIGKVWQRVRFLADGRGVTYPSEPSPPSSLDEGVRCLDSVIIWCLENSVSEHPSKAEGITKNDRRFMEMAIEEARKSRREDDRAHPRVGAVVVKNGLVMACAHRGELGEGEHAEFTALERKLPDDIVAGATVYTTLEPCTTRKQPKVPCAVRLIERQVRRVVIGMVDPNPDIRGLGIRMLQEHNIAVDLFPHDLVAIIEEMNRDFRRQQQTQREKPASQPQSAVTADEIPGSTPGVGYTVAEYGARVERKTPAAKKDNSELKADPFGNALRKLARRGMVALAVRCARRIQPLLYEIPSDWPERHLHLDALEKAIATAEGFVEGTLALGAWEPVDSVGRPLVVANADAALHALGNSEPAATAAAAVFQTAFAAWAAWSSDSEEAVNRTWYAVKTADTAHLRADNAMRGSVPCSSATLVMAAVSHDLQGLLGLGYGDFPNIGKKLNPKPEGPLGPLWPEGEPDWYLEARERMTGVPE